MNDMKCQFVIKIKATLHDKSCWACSDDCPYKQDIHGTDPYCKLFDQWIKRIFSGAYLVVCQSCLQAITYQRSVTK